MNSVKNILLILTGIFFLSCSNWDYNRVINNVNFEKIRYKIQEEDTVKIIGYLKENTMIKGMPCAADWIRLTPDFKPIQFKLFRDTKISNFNFPAGTWIISFDDGYISCVFPKDTTIQGYPVRGGGEAKGVRASVYLNGKLRGFFAIDDLVINGTPCNGSVFSLVYLHENGRLQRCDLAKDHTINGKKYKKGSQLNFDENGKLVE